ncbi:MAG: hemerythrin domain-containing protein [Candidatus Pacearchaeota archaeon]
MGKTVCKIMLKDHAQIMKLLSMFERELTKNLDNSKNLFNKFKWNLNKHFFVEEKVIFSVYESVSEEDNIDILKLLKEHKDIYWLLNKTEDELDANKIPDISELKKLLRSHANFEDKNFYPKLDEELDDKQKAIIFDRAEEIIR